MRPNYRIPPRVALAPEVKCWILQVRTGEFDRVADRIEATWGSQTCEDYLKRLVANLDRDNRAGFPKEVFAAILSLSNVHRAQDARPEARGLSFG